ncbi:SOS response-associated peptidase [bacterium]|nr:SOS response-associated peptidase [bacterium]
MCGRYTTVSRIEEVESRFAARFEKPGLFLSSSNVAPGESAPVILSGRPEVIQLLRFGLTPFWAQKRMLLINARAEGDHNPDNDPLYAGAAGIFQKPSFRKPIRTQRCLVLADGFIEGPEKEKLSKPYLVRRASGDALFAMAGIWDHWTDPVTGEILHGFSIITTAANDLLLQIGHHRAPLILPRELEREWLDERIPTEALSEWFKPFDASSFVAWPIRPDIKKPHLKSMELLSPIGDILGASKTFVAREQLELQGMGHSSARVRRMRQDDKVSQPTPDSAS